MQSGDSAAGAARNDYEAEKACIFEQTNKRVTLNLLIQGAAAHTFLTAHHLVKDDLEATRLGLTRLYDKLVISAHLSYWLGDFILLYGPHARFWRRLRRHDHPLHQHRLLAKHGEMLSLTSKRHLLERGRKKWVIRIPVLHYVQMLWLAGRVAWAERKNRPQLAEIAKKATSIIWGIDEDRLDAELTIKVAFGHLQTPRTIRGQIIQSGIVGYGGVERREGRFYVVGKAWFWPFLSHELVKGTAELVCLHGLNTLDDETYARVTTEADQLEYEVWSLQVGPELWRRLLAVMPDDRPLPEVLMHIARLDPQPLEHLMLAVIEEPQQARQLLAKFGE
jgi:hypothetical protein